MILAQRTAFQTNKELNQEVHQEVDLIAELNFKTLSKLIN
jgi:hypothetical protein